MIDTTKMTLRVNIITVPGASFDELIAFAKEEQFNQMTLVAEKDGTWALSAPLSCQQQLRYQWLYHRMAAKNKTPPEPPKGGPKPPNGKPPKGTPPTPPTGGTPGAMALEEPEELLMVA